MFASNSSRPLWTYVTGIGLPVFQTPSAVSISDDGAYVSTGGDVGQSGTVAVLVRSNNVPLWTLKPAFDASASVTSGHPYVTTAMSGNGEYVAAHALLATPSVTKASIVMFRRSGGLPLWFHNTTDNGHTDLAPISLSYEGAFLATIDPLSHTLYVFSQHDNKTLWTRKDSSYTVLISGTGDFVAAGNNTSVNIFGKDSNNTLLSLTSRGIYLSDFSRDGSTIAAIEHAGYTNATVNLFDRLTGKQLFSQTLLGVDMMSVSSNGSETAAATETGDLSVYNRSGSLICSAKQGTGTRTLVAISGDGRFVVTGNYQLTYMAITSPNQTLYIVEIVAGIGATTAATVFLTFLTIRSRRRHLGVNSAPGNPSDNDK